MGSNVPQGWLPTDAPDSASAAITQALPNAPSTVPGGWVPTSAPVESAPPAHPVPFTESVAHGIVDPAIGAAQLISKAGGSWGDPELAQQFPFSSAPPTQMMSPEETQSAIAKQEKDYESQRAAAGQTGPDIGRIAGNLVAPTNFMVPGGATGNLISRLGKAAITGAAMSGSMPAYGDDFWSQKAQQLGVGAAFGAGGEGVIRALAPGASADAQMLLDKGVPLTPGQAGGPIAKAYEKVMRAFPILGNFVSTAEGRGVEGLNRAVINQALKPITGSDASLPASVAIGHPAITYGQNLLNDAYENVAPKTTFKMDQPFLDGLEKINNDTATMPPAQKTQLTNLLQHRIMGRLQQDGTIDGVTAKQIDSELGQFGSRYLKSPDPAQQDLGQNALNLKSLLRDNLIRNSADPQTATELRNIDAAYAMFTRVESAASKATAEGKFTPTDLLSAIRMADKSVRHNSFAAGDALLQPFAEAANRVMPLQKEGHSGLVGGVAALAAEHGLGYLFEGVHGLLPLAAGTAAVGAASALPYTRFAAPVTRQVVPAIRAGIRSLPTPAGGIVGEAPLSYSWPSQ